MRDPQQRGWRPGSRSHLLARCRWLSFILLHLYAGFLKSLSKLFAGDVLETVMHSEDRYLGRPGDKTEERYLILEERQEWKARNSLPPSFIKSTGGPQVSLNTH